MRLTHSAILTSVSLIALGATPAFAQAVPTTPADTIPEETVESEQVPPTSTPTEASGEPATENPGTIVVTGSRIRRDNFSTPQNVDVFTRNDAVLAGTRSTTEALQSSTVTSGTSQISGSFLGFLSDNGQGANTVGLRGLGAARTLVLLNGRRLAPAGVGPQLIAADLNTLPTSVVQRVEVLREGASSVYGSDAIAGVINVITDTELDGITIDAYADVPEIGAGETLRASITAGKTFDRGHIMASFEFRDDRGLAIGDRPDTRCPRELAYVNGIEVGQTVPFSTELRCFPYARAGGGNAAGYGVSVFAGGVGPVRATFPGYHTGNPDIFAPPQGVADNASTDYNLRNETAATIFDTTVFTPLRTYTAYLNGAYELGALGNAELYGEALFVRRKTEQFGPDRPDWSSLPVGIYGDAGSYPEIWGPDYGPYEGLLADYGYPVSPFFPVSWSDAGMYLFYPFWAPDRIMSSKQKVDFWRANAGLRGDTGLGDWRYDFNVQLSSTSGRDDRQTLTTERITNVLITTLAPAGTPAQYTTTAIPGQYRAGETFTCASNVTNGVYNGGTCQPVNIFDPNVLVNGAITDAQFDYLYPWINYTKTDYRQETFALGFDGSLFPLQGGMVKGAFGFERRHDYINDVPGPERQADQLYRYGSALQTEGRDNVTEAYAELNLPFFRDRPGIHLLEANVSGRYTDYDSYGSDFTYALGAQYAPIPAIRIRGNYSTNFRAPNLYEQYVADEVGFYPNSFDPCVNFVATSSPGSAVYENCLAELTEVLGSEEAALAFNPPGGSFQIVTSGGIGNVKAETAKVWGFGTVLTAPRSLADLTLAIDYWNIKVKDQVSTLGNNILNFCYQSPDRSSPYCEFIVGRRGFDHPEITDPAQAGSIDVLLNPYLNVAQQNAEGIDFDARFARRFFGGEFQTQLQATRMLSQETEFYPGGGLNQYNGTLGYPGFGAGPKWTGSLDTRFTTANDITFRWGVRFIGKMSGEQFESSLYLTQAGDVCSAGTEGCFLVDYDYEVGNYFEHGISAQWLWRNVGAVTIGVNNLFDRDPEVISDDNVNGYPRFGNFFANAGYDYRGRSFFINVTRSFK